MSRYIDSDRMKEALELILQEGLEGLAQAISIIVNEAMKIQRERFLGAGPYERTEGRRGYANGFKERKLKAQVGELDLRVPQVRDVQDGAKFYPKALERGQRSERALSLALVEMYVKGVATRKVTDIVEKLVGFEVSSSQVSRLCQKLDRELEAWRTRPLGKCDYLLLDARYEKVRQGGQVVSQAVMIAIGIQDGKRIVLGVEVGNSEAEVNWRSFLSFLKERGLHGIQMVTSDDHEGLKAALEAVFPGVPWQRCQVHITRNATNHAPTAQIRDKLPGQLREIFESSTRQEAERLLDDLVTTYEKQAPKLADWLETNVPEGFTVFALPVPYRRKLRTTNLSELLNREIRRRTKVVGVFPNRESLLRLVTAVLVEISEAWENGRRYLPELKT